jgi:isochorismate synthase
MTASLIDSDRDNRLLTLDELWHTARAEGLPVVLWQLPNQPDKHLMIQFEPTLAPLPADLDELPTGFLLSSFLNTAPADGEPFRVPFLRADAHFVRTDDGTVHDESPAENAHRVTLLTDRLAQQPNHPTTNALPASQTRPDPDAQRRFEAAVADAVEQMEQGAFRKVVLSRTKQVDFAAEPDAVALFERLSMTYPSAFVAAVWLPEEAQTWICATPERLVSQDADSVFRTVSLAGTQSALHPDGAVKRPADAVWTQKEIEEQALVSRYIIDCFKKIRLREYVESGPKTVMAGNLMHLRTDYAVDMRATNFPQLGTVMLRLLHPTSAVCGMPRQAALSFIQAHETHNRELYAGFVGPVNVQGTSQLFVHLRCLKLEGTVATLYAGAGLTEDSVPAREWAETELKCQTLLRVLQA